MTGSSRIAYVDGLNFKSAVRDRPETKWADFRALADRLVPRAGSEVLRVHDIKHDPSREHGACANAGGRPPRSNAA